MKLPCFGCEDWLNVWENEATLDIAQSTISSFTLEELIEIGGKTNEEFFNELLKKKMNYGWIEGSPEFKEEVSKIYKNVKPEQILQTNGCTGANLLVMLSLIEKGDHVISMYPIYQQLCDLPEGLGAEVEKWHIKEENNWLPDLNELRNMIRDNTKMICINNAHNPTGAVMDEAFLTELVEIARSCGAYILSDEVYKPMEETYVPAIVDIYEKGISTNSVSKTYSVPGVRVGWVASSLEVTEIFKSYRDYTMICCGVFDDYVATYALKNKDKILKRNKAIIDHNFSILKEWVENEPRVSLIYPKHVSVCFIKLDIPMEIEEFCTKLLKDTGVLLIPGNRFDVDKHARLGYCAKTETLKKGLAALSKYLRQFD